MTHARDEQQGRALDLGRPVRVLGDLLGARAPLDDYLGALAMTTTLTHPDKVLWPERGLTKGDLAAYYEAAADRMLPQLRDRPVTLKRFNDGVDGEGFFQKNVPASTPASVARASRPGPARRTGRSPTRSSTTPTPCGGAPSRTPSSCTRGSAGSTNPPTPTSAPSTSTPRRPTRTSLPRPADVRDALADLGLDGAAEDERQARPARVRADRAPLRVRRPPRLHARGGPPGRRPAARHVHDRDAQGRPGRAAPDRLEPGRRGPDPRGRLEPPGHADRDRVDAAGVGRARRPARPGLVHAARRPRTTRPVGGRACRPAASRGGGRRAGGGRRRAGGHQPPRPHQRPQDPPPRRSVDRPETGRADGGERVPSPAWRPTT